MNKNNLTALVENSSTQNPNTDPIYLRVVLDGDATQSYEKMAAALKIDGFVKLTPSKFLSFMTNFFCLNYFEKDKEVLLSEFFDSKEYVARELKGAKTSSEIAGVLERSMLKVRKMQDLKKRADRSIAQQRKVKESTNADK